MALITCPACHKEVSDQAFSCPHCGQPLRSAEENVQTIQHTQKRWKKQSLIGLAIWLFGVYLFISAFWSGEAWRAALGFFIGFIGFMMMLFAKVGAWWSNG